MRCWRSTEPILSPVLLELYTIDNIDKCVISIGTPISSDEDSGPRGSRRCWCQLNRPCEPYVDVELGHNRRQAPCARFGMSMPVIEQRRLLQLQWWNQILSVFLDGHLLGSLSLANCQLPDWAQVSIHLFSPSDRTPCITKSHMAWRSTGTAGSHHPSGFLAAVFPRHHVAGNLQRRSARDDAGCWFKWFLAGCGSPTTNAHQRSISPLSFV